MGEGEGGPPGPDASEGANINQQENLAKLLNRVAGFGLIRKETDGGAKQIVHVGKGLCLECGGG